MSQLILFLIVAALLFASLFLLVRRAPQGQGEGEALAEARQALNTLQFGLLPPELVGRIFAKADLDYVTSVGSKQIRRAYCRDRKRIALLWIGEVRRKVVSLRQFHLGAARSFAHINLRTEMRLARDFAALLLVCRFVQVLIYVGGPYAAPQMVGFTMRIAGRVCEISEKSLAFLSPAYGTGAPRRSGTAAP